MSLEVNLSNLATRQATEAKSLRTLINGNLADLSTLDTTAVTNLVAAINEVYGLATSGSVPAASETVAGKAELATQAETNAGTDDLRIVTPLKFQTRLAAYAQPLDTDLTNIAALTTTVYGRAFLELANQAALVALLPNYQPLDSDLTNIAALTTTSYGRAFLELANQAGLMALLSAATTSAAGIVELATEAETTTGTDTVRAVTPAGVAAAIAAVVDAAPTTLDTLNELAAALGDDPNFATSITTLVGTKQPLDATLTALAGVTTAANKVIYATGADTFATTDFTAFGRTLAGSADAAAARSSLSVYSQAEIGNPETDFVAIFEAGLV